MNNNAILVAGKFSATFLDEKLVSKLYYHCQCEMSDRTDMHALTDNITDGEIYLGVTQSI